MDDYLNAGTALVWVANPRRKTITVHRPKSQPLVLREDETLDGADVLAGFQCRVGDIFA